MATKDLTVQFWQRIRYSPSTTNCGNCSHADKHQWVGDNGVCNLFAALSFKVLRHGICKLHSAFNGGNIKR
jgi:hypothetical protein